MNLLQNSIANYTRLIESLALVRSQTANQFEELSEENKGENQRPRASVHSEKKLQQKIADFEEKLRQFLRQPNYESDFHLEAAHKLKEQERKSHRRIQNAESLDAIDDELGEEQMKKSFEKKAVLGLKKLQSEDPKGLPKFDKGQEYCLEAHCLLEGHGIEPSTEDAILWFEKSANLGEPRAVYALGKIHEEGVGVRVDMAKALQYYERAAELGDSQA